MFDARVMRAPNVKQAMCMGNQLEVESRSPLDQHSSQARPKDSSGRAASEASRSQTRMQCSIEQQVYCAQQYVATRLAETKRSLVER